MHEQLTAKRSAIRVTNAADRTRSLERAWTFVRPRVAHARVYFGTRVSYTRELVTREKRGRDGRGSLRFYIDDDGRKNRAKEMDGWRASARAIGQPPFATDNGKTFSASRDRHPHAFVHVCIFLNPVLQLTTRRSSCRQSLERPTLRRPRGRTDS